MSSRHVFSCFSHLHLFLRYAIECDNLAYLQDCKSAAVHTYINTCQQRQPITRWAGQQATATMQTNQTSSLQPCIKYQANAVLHASTSTRTSNFYNLVKNNASAGPKNCKLQQRDANLPVRQHMAVIGSYSLYTTFPSLCFMPHAPTLITKYNTPKPCRWSLVHWYQNGHATLPSPDADRVVNRSKENMACQKRFRATHPHVSMLSIVPYIYTHAPARSQLCQHAASNQMPTLMLQHNAVPQNGLAPI